MKTLMLLILALALTGCGGKPASVSGSYYGYAREFSYNLELGQSATQTRPDPSASPGATSTPGPFLLGQGTFAIRSSLGDSFTADATGTVKGNNFELMFTLPETIIKERGLASMKMTGKVVESEDPEAIKRAINMAQLMSHGYSDREGKYAEDKLPKKLRWLEATIAVPYAEGFALNGKDGKKMPYLSREGYDVFMVPVP